MTAPDPDVEIFARWAAGDRTAGAELFDRYFEPVARFFRNKVAKEVDVQDELVQTTFTACLAAGDSFRAEGSFRSFLFSIAYNQLRKHYERARKAARIDFGTVSVHDLGRGPSTMMAERAEQALLLDALGRLPVELQTALELHYWESMTMDEIGAALGMPAGTVKTRLRRARALLREDIERQQAPATVQRAALAALDDG